MPGPFPVVVLAIFLIPVHLTAVFMIWTFLPAPGPRARGAWVPASTFTLICLVSVPAIFALYLVTRGLVTLGGCHPAWDAATRAFVTRCPDLPGSLPLWADAVRIVAMGLMLGLPVSALVTELCARGLASPLPPGATKG